MATKAQNTLAKLKKQLQAMPKEARRTIRKALEKGAYDIAESARAFAPVDDGDLRRSIDFTFGQYTPDNANVRGVGSTAGFHDKDLSVTVHAGDEKAYYASFVEFGTKAHPAGGKFKGATVPAIAAQPYFYPAYRANKKKVVAGVNRAITKAAKEAVKK